MTTWPSTNKALTTTTDQASDRIDLARTDINKTISNVNDIIDIFNIPASPTDNYILKYNASTGVFDMEADASGGGGIALTDLSVTQNTASGLGTLAYNNTSGVFTYTPPKLTGTADIWVPVQAMYPTADGGSSNITTVEVTEGNPELRVIDFDTATTEYAQFSIAMPKSWNEGTITYEAYWTASSGTGGVSWGLQAVGISNDDAIATAFGTAQVVDDTLIATNDLHISPTSSALTVGGTPTAGDITFFQVYRDTADANDTLSADARLIGIKIHYTTEAGTDD